VLVAGQGPIGLMFTRLLALRGMKVLAIDLMAERLSLARKYGAAATSVPAKPNADEGRTSRAKAPSWHSALDAAVLATPSDEAVLDAQARVRGGGQVLLFAHTRRGAKTALDLATVCVDEKDLIGSYSSDFTLQAEVARLVFSRKLDVRPLITHQFPLDQTAAAIELASRPTPRSLKIVVTQ
jgi:L-iditol 2-dehydrogenase